MSKTSIQILLNYCYEQLMKIEINEGCSIKAPQADTLPSEPPGKPQRKRTNRIFVCVCVCVCVCVYERRFVIEADSCGYGSKKIPQWAVYRWRIRKMSGII